MSIVSIAFLSSLLSIVYGFFLAKSVLGKSRGDEKMIGVQQAIESGARAYLKRQNTSILFVGILMALLLLIWLNNINIVLGFIVGAMASLLASYVGMMVSVKANVMVAEKAKKGLPAAFSLAFRGGSVTGFFVVGLALISVTAFYSLTNDPSALIGLAFGSSLISVFTRLGGGIFTKGADVGADLVGKVEEGIPEDDPRNPAVIADNVGDNVGDNAGMAADIFETYIVSAVTVMVLGNFLYQSNRFVIEAPLLIGAVSIIASIVGSSFVSYSRGIIFSLYKGLAATIFFQVILFWLISTGRLFSLPRDINFFSPLLLGIIATIAVVIVTEYYTSKNFNPVQKIVKSSVNGQGINIIMGLAVSMQSTVIPMIIISATMYYSFLFAGFYGVAIASMSMISLSGIMVAIDAFGPIADNAGGIAEMAGLPKSVRESTDLLDAVGNTTKAVTKGYAKVAAGLSALALFVSYTQELALFSAGQVIVFDISDIGVLVGLFIGGMMTYLFSSMVMESVGIAASSVAIEARRQFREIKGIMDGTAKPDYSECVDVVTKVALREMMAPALIPVVIPIAVGFVLGAKALGGLLVGVIITGTFLGISMTSGGAAWDNAKKYIEAGNCGGKNSFAHQSAVIGDTVGDSYKDTAGPALNPMIKVANIVALLIAKFIVR